MIPSVKLPRQRHYVCLDMGREAILPDLLASVRYRHAQFGGKTTVLLEEVILIFEENHGPPRRSYSYLRQTHASQNNNRTAAAEIARAVGASPSRTTRLGSPLPPCRLRPCPAPLPM